VTATVRRLDAADAGLLRGLRLAALRDAPYAFNATVADAEALGDDDWRERLGEQSWFAAERDGRGVGIVACGQLRVADATRRTVRSMWVAPEERGTGTAAALLTAAVAWARDDGADAVVLWALQAAERAHAFYVRFGFQEIPDAPSPHPELDMTRYELVLRGAR
jgi:GNAT superfamily N-acetyltransferase